MKHTFTYDELSILQLDAGSNTSSAVQDYPEPPAPTHWRGGEDVQGKIKSVAVDVLMAIHEIQPEVARSLARCINRAWQGFRGA